MTKKITSHIVEGYSRIECWVIVVEKIPQKKVVDCGIAHPGNAI
jgi:hypothetical protein